MVKLLGALAGAAIIVGIGYFAGAPPMQTGQVAGAFLVACLGMALIGQKKTPRR